MGRALGTIWLSLVCLRTQDTTERSNAPGGGLPCGMRTKATSRRSSPTRRRWPCNLASSPGVAPDGALLKAPRFAQVYKKGSRPQPWVTQTQHVLKNCLFSRLTLTWLLEGYDCSSLSHAERILPGSSSSQCGLWSAVTFL